MVLLKTGGNAGWFARSQQGSKNHEWNQFKNTFLVEMRATHRRTHTHFPELLHFHIHHTHITYVHIQRDVDTHTNHTDTLRVTGSDRKLGGLTTV